MIVLWTSSIYDTQWNFVAEVVHDASSITLVQMQIKIPCNNHCIAFTGRIKWESLDTSEDAFNIIHIIVP